MAPDRLRAVEAIVDAWAGWVGVLRGHRWGIDAILRPPVEESALAAAEHATGMAVPSEVAALLRLADGQWGAREARGLAVRTNVFPGYEFLPLERAVRTWLGWRDIRDEYGPDGLREDFDDMITVRAGDHVHAVYTRAPWWPFAEDGGGNQLWVDTDPPPGGTRGQVIVAGPDEDERRVLAPDLATYLRRLAAADLDPPDPQALADGVAWWDAPDLR